MANHPNRSRKGEMWFSPLDDDDEKTIQAVIERYGYARVHAALIRRMPKDFGKKWVEHINLSDLNL
jgi:hypothetical protein